MFGLILHNRFVRLLALIADTRRVSPLAQNYQKRGKAYTRRIAYRAKTNTEAIMMYTKALQKAH